METFGCTQSLLEKIPCQQSSCHAKDCSGTPRSGKLRRFLRKGGLKIGNSWFKKKKKKTWQYYMPLCLLDEKREFLMNS